MNAPKLALESKLQRHRIVSEASHALYRWYLTQSQRVRNWNPEQSFDWKALCPLDDVTIVEMFKGFYAVEQFAPDYTSELIKLSRTDYGHSQFQIRWGAEEQRHSDAWRNILLFSTTYSARNLEEWTSFLRAKTWAPPFATSLEMLFYTLFQERATQLVYNRTVCHIRSGQTSIKPSNISLLQRVISAIANDEAAHYGFFLALARVNLYYLPEMAVPALINVIRNFVMPAADIIPTYSSFVAALHSAQIFGPRIYAKHVAKPTLAAIGIESLQEIERQLNLSNSEVAHSSVVNTAFLSIKSNARLASSLHALFSRLDLDVV